MKKRKPRFEIKSGLVIRLNQNWKLFLLVSIYIAGMISGAIAFKNTDNVIISKLMEIFEGFRSQRDVQSILANFCNSFLSSFIYLLLTFSAGVCAIGIPIIILLPYLKGLGLGMISGYLYGTYGLKGIGYCVLIIYPAAILSVTALLFACNESIMMSRDIFTLLKQKRLVQNSGNFKMYCARYIVLFFLIIFSSLLDALFTRAFSGFFVF